MEVDWLNINPMSGGTGQTEIYAYVTENEKVGGTRNALVRFTNGEGLTADLNLSQTSNTEDMRFVLTPDYLFVPAEGGTYIVNLLTNTFWKVSDYDSGLTITTDNFEGYGDGILTITFPVNPNTNNQYGYDHYGRPFYGRRGLIYVSSLMGTFRILWEQVAYNAITVTPNKLNFPQTGGSMTVTVKSSMDWTLTSYDSATTTISPVSGHSGETVVTVSKQALTPTQLAYYVTKASTALFSDGLNTAALSIDSTLDGYYIEDDYLTITYYVPSANTEIAIYRVEYGSTNPPTEKLYQDNNWKNERSEFVQYGSADPGRAIHYVTYTTAGYHSIKYKFDNGIIMPKYFLYGNSNVYKIVVGNLCSGAIAACSAMGSGAKEIILGLGNITLIGEYAFYGCGSTARDLVIGTNVQAYIYQPFHQVKARKLVWKRPDFGGANTGTGATQSTTTGSIRKFIISGSTTSWDSSDTVTGIATYKGWNDDKAGYPGDITCQQLVIGENVERIHNTPFYPYGIRLVRKDAETYSAEYQYASTSYWGSDSGPNSRITGWTVPSIAFVSRTSPAVDTYAFTPVTQTFRRGNPPGGVFSTRTKGPTRNIPLHFPIGTQQAYQGWSTDWSNRTFDLDL